MIRSIFLYTTSNHSFHFLVKSSKHFNLFEYIQFYFKVEFKPKLTPKFVVKHSPYFNYTFCLNKYNFLYEVQLQNMVENFINSQIIISSTLRCFENYDLFSDQIKTDAEFKFKSTISQNTGN